MTASLKQLKQINEKTKMSVFGYVKEMQLKLSLCNVPTMISYLCLAYHSHGEYFNIYGNNFGIIK